MRGHERRLDPKREERRDHRDWREHGSRRDERDRRDSRDRRDDRGRDERRSRSRGSGRRREERHGKSVDRQHSSTHHDRRESRSDRRSRPSHEPTISSSDTLTSLLRVHLKPSENELVEQVLSMVSKFRPVVAHYFKDEYLFIDVGRPSIIPRLVRDLDGTQISSGKRLVVDTVRSRVSSRSSTDNIKLDPKLTELFLQNPYYKSLSELRETYFSTYEEYLETHQEWERQKRHLLDQERQLSTSLFPRKLLLEEWSHLRGQLESFPQNWNQAQ